MSVTSDSNVNTIVFPLTVLDLRKRLKLAGFKGSVRSLDALGTVSDDDFRCAHLRCHSNGPAEVFINTHTRCSHLHLTVDVMDLVNAFNNGDLDHGWDLKPGGDAETSVVTRESAAAAGVPPSHWATNPYRRN